MLRHLIKLAALTLQSHNPQAVSDHGSHFLNVYNTKEQHPLVCAFSSITASFKKPKILCRDGWLLKAQSHIDFLTWIVVIVIFMFASDSRHKLTVVQALILCEHFYIQVITPTPRCEGKTVNKKDGSEGKI